MVSQRESKSLTRGTTVFKSMKTNVRIQYEHPSFNEKKKHYKYHAVDKVIEKFGSQQTLRSQKTIGHGMVNRVAMAAQLG